MQQSVYRKRMSVMLLTAGLISGCASMFSGTSQRSTEIRGDQAPNLTAPYNKPYKVQGVTYYPMQSAAGYQEVGHASWYGSESGNRTAMGTRFIPQGLTAAHKTLPLPSKVRVTNLHNGRHVDVLVNDRGPFLHERVIDLSYTAAYKLGIIGKGSAEVEVESVGADAAVIIPMDSEGVRSEPLPPEAVPITAAAPVGNVYLQLGAFKSQQSAESFVTRMRAEFEGSGKQVVLYQKNDDLMRVHLGPYAGQEDARTAADQVQSRLGFKPLVSVH